jgi:hypothetical protein
LTQLCQADQTLLIGRDEPCDVVSQSRLFTPQDLAALSSRISVPRGLDAAVNFSLNQRSVVQQVDDLSPHK